MGQGCIRAGSLAACALALCLGPWVESAHAYCRMTVEEPMPSRGCPDPGTELEWRRQCISYSLVERTGPGPSFEDVRDAADRAFGAWTDVRCDGAPVPLLLAQTEELSRCDQAEYNQRHGNVNSVFFVDDWVQRGLDRDAFGITIVWHNPQNGEIFDADMQLNEQQGRFEVCGARCGPGEVDIENVITHEAGHFLGLGHSTVSGSTMHWSATLGETSKRDLAQDDIDGICALFGDFPEPSCSLRDYAPDRGFLAECVGEEAASGGGASCSARIASGASSAGGGGLLLMLLSLWGYRRLRRPVSASSARPKASIK